MLTKTQKETFNKELKRKAVWHGSPFVKNHKLEVAGNMKFVSDLGFDSLDSVEFLMEIEKKFNIAISDDKAETIKTVNDFYKVIDDCLKKKSKTIKKAVTTKPKTKKVKKTRK